MPAEPWPPPATNGNGGASPKPAATPTIPPQAPAALAGPVVTNRPPDQPAPEPEGEPAPDAAEPDAQPSAPTESSRG